MLFGLHTFGRVPFAWVDGAGEGSPFEQVWDAEFGRTFLYELSVFRRATHASWIFTFGRYPFGTVPPGADVTGDVTLRFSDTGYLSKPNDSVANLSWDGAISSGLNMTRTLPATPEASRRVNTEVGSFGITNTDGELDAAVLAYAVDGRRVRVLLGMTAYRYDLFTPIFTGRIRQWGNDLSTVTVQIEDEGHRLDIPLQTSIYGGTGGIDGGADLTGKPRPMTFGQCLNLQPPMINAAYLVYQCHHRLIQAVDAVYDRGAVLINDGDHASYAALTAAVITTGHYATCLALGLIRLGSTPSGLVTADVRGDATGGYVDTTQNIAKRIATDFGGLAATELDLAVWNAFETSMPGTIGWHRQTSSMKVSEALTEIFGHCAGWWGARPDGLIQCGRITAPSTAAAYVMEIPEADDMTLEILEPLAGTFPPRYSQRVAYQRLWTTQQDTDLAGAVTAARRAYLAQESRFAQAEDVSVRTAFKLAQNPPPLDALFYNQSDAENLADELLALYKVFRQTVRISMNLRGFRAVMGASVLVTHSRLNGGTPTPMLVMDLTILADDRRVELVLWG